MKIYLDACAIDWLLDDPRSGDFFGLLQEGRLKAFVGGDVVREIARTPVTKGDKRLRLLSIVFGGVLRLAPTRLPMVGRHRRSMIWSVPAPPEAAALLGSLRRLGIGKLDAIHLIEAKLAGATAFITKDREDLLRIHEQIKIHTCVEVIPPEEVLQRLGR